MTSANVFAVILAGGSGSRFWPASRAERPKQVLPLGPDPSQPLIRHTLRRVRQLCDPGQVLVATGESLLEITQRALPELPPSAFMAEPMPKNTAPCIVWAAERIALQDPEAVLMVLPSDHHIGDEAEFRRVIERAVSAAHSGRITTVGIRPNRPETGYGYIEGGAELSPGVLRVLRFVEKPDRERAQLYLESERFFWNSGMFFFRAADMRAAALRYLPEVAQGVAEIERAAQQGRELQRESVLRVFKGLPSISIDYGIMERLEDMAVVPGDFGWSDLGSWHSVWELGTKDAEGNVAPAHALLSDAQRNLVSDLRASSEARTIALLGVNDLCVIETDDALLILPRDRAQDVRAVVDALKRRGGPI